MMSRNGLEVARLEVADLLGVATVGERGEPDEVREQDGDQPPFGDLLPAADADARHSCPPLTGSYAPVRPSA